MEKILLELNNKQFPLILLLPNSIFALLILFLFFNEISLDIKKNSLNLLDFKYLIMFFFLLVNLAFAYNNVMSYRSSQKQKNFLFTTSTLEVIDDKTKLQATILVDEISEMTILTYKGYRRNYYSLKIRSTDNKEITKYLTLEDIVKILINDEFLGFIEQRNIKNNFKQWLTSNSLQMQIQLVGGFITLAILLGIAGFLSYAAFVNITENAGKGKDFGSIVVISIFFGGAISFLLFLIYYTLKSILMLFKLRNIMKN
ncbi:MAG: hypothetical protein N3E37_04840 [Candidatus Micrarchaeota archaeon]|nr:hypothetical protein [Candidatus Micrarchaeota archaeon]